MKTCRTVPLAVLLLFAVFDRGCNKDSSVLGPDNNPTQSGTSGTIGPSGGSIQVVIPGSPINNAFVQIPGGLLQGNTTISISPAASDVRAPLDSQATVIELGPSGQRFASPVRIGIPINSLSGSQATPRAFWFSSNPPQIRQLIVDSVDFIRQIVIARTDHFSKFFASTNTDPPGIQMVNVNGGFGARVVAPDFFRVPILTSYAGITNPYGNAGNLCSSPVSGQKSIFTVTLKEYDSRWFHTDPTLASSRYYVERVGVDYVYYSFYVIKDLNTSPVYASTAWQAREPEGWAYLRGAPIVFKFEGIAANPSKLYYLKLEWVLAEDKEGNRQITSIYEYDSQQAKQSLSSAPIDNTDRNNNGVDDSYEANEGRAPWPPSGPIPNDQATNQATSLTLSWTPSTDPDGDPLNYDVFFGTDNPPSAVIAEGQTGTSANVNSLSPGTWHFWRVQVNDPHNNTVSGPVWSFKTGGVAIQVPPAPTLVYPTDKAPDIPISPTLSWNASSGATAYQLQVSANADLSAPVFDQAGLTSPSKQVAGLSAGITYYWRVNASNSAGTSGWSTPVWSFTTASGVVPPPVPVLLAPANGSTGIATNPTLTWNASSGATAYQLQVSANADLSTPVFDQAGLTSPSKQVAGLSAGITYYWRVNASNSAGTSGWSSPVWKFTTGSGGSGSSPCPGIPTVTYAGKTYNTVLIGNQCWLKENLDVGTMVQGTADQTDNGTIEKYCYGNDPANCVTYGGLYQWDEAMQYSTAEGVQGICPPGWHIPTYYEFGPLIQTVNQDGNALKAVGQGTGAGAGTNTSGFSALLAGYRASDGGFRDLGYGAYFWSSTQYGATGADLLGVFYDTATIGMAYYGKPSGLSVRCLQD